MKFKFLFFLSVLFLGFGQIWGQTETLTITRDNFPSGALIYGTDDLWTATTSGGVEITGYFDLFSNAGQTTMQTRTNTPIGSYPYNIVAMPGNITKITLIGGGTGTARSWTPYLSSTPLTKSNFTSGQSQGAKTATNNSASTVWEIDPSEGFIYFYLNMTGGAAYLNSIIIEYEIPITGDHTITVTQPTGGEITPETTGVDDGDSASFTATAESSCYTFSHWVVDGVDAGNTNPYDFINVTADHEITAVFNAVAPYTIMATAGANGSISPNGATSANCGVNQTFTITPYSGYAVADVLVNGVSVGAVTTYTFENVTANQTISASFVEYTGPCVSEDFENIPTNNAGSYLTRIWTGNDGIEWTVDDSRTDQTITGKAVGLRTSTLTTTSPVAGGVGTLSFDYKRTFGGNSTLKVFVNGTQYGGDITVTSETPANFSVDVNVGGNVTIELVNSTNRIAVDNLSWTCYSAAPAPQISVTPSGEHDFGNQLVGSTSTPATFTIANTGNADLTIGTIALSGANADQFLVTQAGSSTVTQGNNTTFTVSFSPTSLGSKTATVTIPNNDEDYTITVTGNGSNSAASDITTNTGFDYTDNIAYANYQIPTITNTSNSVGVFQFAVRDGGGSADDDTNPTTLTDISFNYTGTANTIRAAALFNGNAHIANGTVTANGISFSGLSIVAPDNGSSDNITLRVSFTETVTDNQKLIFTVASATANATGSVFAQPNAGGAFSDNNNTNNRNRLEVVADRLAFAQQPSGTSVNTNLAAFVIAGVDQFGNTDVDATNSITLTTSGTGMTASPSYTLSNGTVSISNVQFNTSQTGITITATTTGLAFSNTVTSTPFDISDLATGTYRTTSNGTWPAGATPATWEKLTAGGWNPATPSSSTTDLLIIRHTITSNGSFAATGGVGTKMLVENGGIFNAGHNSTFGTLTVQSGGVFSVNDPAVDILAGTGTLTVENGGKLILNSGTLDSLDGLWEGIENFQNGSTVELQNWDWGNSGSGAYTLLNSTTQISSNSNGYYFGNLIINATPTENFRIIRNSVDPGTGNYVKLCENNLEITNNAAAAITMQLANGTNNRVEIGGNVIINKGVFRFAVLGSSIVQHNIKGNLTVNNTGVTQFNSTANGGAYVDLRGNLDVKTGGSLNGTVHGSKLIFSGEATTPQTISIAGTLGTYVDFEVANGAEVHLINQHLDLTNSTNDFTVLEGGSLYFNYFNTTGSGKLTLNSGGILKITDAQGLQSSGASGNVQSAREFSQTGHFHYVGNVTPQSTGNAMTSGSTAKRIVVNKDNATDVVNLASSTGTTNELYIAKGIFTETEAAHINGSGSLTIDYEGYYRTAVTSNNTPRLSGTYTLANNSTVELNANADQSLNHGQSYGNLIFSNGGITTSGTTLNIAGTVTIKDATTLNVSNNTFGGTTTNLTMENTGVYINGGSGVKPDMGGNYTLASGTTIEFMGTSATQIRVAPDYANIIVSGTNVTAGTTDSAGLSFQEEGSFTVKDGATFKVNNPDGFTGSATSSIKNAEVLAAISLEPNSTIEYNGSEAQTITNGAVTTPVGANYENLIISGTGAKTLPDNPNSFVQVNNDFTVNSGEFIIETGKALSVKNIVTNIAGANNFIIENDASLVQINNVDNIGNITAHRHTQAMVKFDATYWSSPVAGQKVKAFSQGTLDNRFYIYNGINESDINSLNGHFKAIFVADPNYPMPDSIPSTWYERPEEVSNNLFVKSEYTFKPGWGYSIRVPNNWGFPMDAPGGVYERQFVGVPHNGDIEVPAYGKYTMVGNPYPSAVEIEKFFDDNSDVTALHFWTHYHDVLDENYNSNYSTVTQLGGAGNYTVGTHIMNDNIEVGQGFVVEHALETMPETNTDDWPVYFNNDMRVKERGVFQKQTNTNIEKHRFWIDLKDENDKNIAQILVGYMTGATNDYDHQIEGAKMGTAPLYSLIGEDKFTVQGRELPFSNEDIVPLGLSPIVSGKYKMVLNSADGLFEEGQEIYLKDNFMNVIHNLSTDGLYDFDTELGDFFNRFEIIYKTEEVMSTTDMDDSLVKIYQSKENIIVESEKEKILSVELYDLSGRIIHKNNKVNANIYQVRKTSLGSQILVVKVLTEKGDIVTKKIINH